MNIIGQLLIRLERFVFICKQERFYLLTTLYCTPQKGGGTEELGLGSFVTFVHREDDGAQRKLN